MAAAGSPVVDYHANYQPNNGEGYSSTPAFTQDDEYDPYNSDMYFSRYHDQEESQQEEQHNTMHKIWLSNIVQHKNVAIFTSITVIGLLQFQGPVLRWCRTRLDVIRAGDHETSALELLWDIVCGVVGTLVDYCRAARQICSETIRNSVSSVQMLFGFSRHNSAEGHPHGQVGGRGRARGRCNSLPELEELIGSEPSLVESLDTNVKEVKSGQNTDHALFVKDSDDSLVEGKAPANTDDSQLSALPFHEKAQVCWEWGFVSHDLEPAFLDEKDYPRNWQVYHAVLRVVAKAEADRYEREQTEDKNVQCTEIEPEQHVAADNRHVEEKKDDSFSQTSTESEAVVSPSVQHSNHNTSSSQTTLPVLRSIAAS